MHWKQQWRRFNFSKIIIYIFAFVCICPHLVAIKHWSHVKKSQQLIVNCTYIHKRLQFLWENIIKLKKKKKKVFCILINCDLATWWWSMARSAFCWNYLDRCFLWIEIKYQFAEKTHLCGFMTICSKVKVYRPNMSNS